MRGMVANAPPHHKGNEADPESGPLQVRVSAWWAALGDPDDPEDPILRQVLRSPEEDAPQPDGFVDDPVGDLADGARRAPGLVVRYPGRALLLTDGPCAIHCRFCFRRALPPRPPEPLDEALEAIAADASLSEVILSGGDPLGMDDRRLAELLERLAAIPHLRRVRLHTRHPVASPARVSRRLVEAITSTRLRPWVVVHANHARELAPEAVAALRRLLDAGIPVLSQSVLLRGVNDEVDVLVDLFERLVDAGVKPYYLHQLDRVSGAAHFEVPEDEGRALMESLRRRLTGIAIPTWVRDVPGRLHKQVIPLMAAALLVALSACSCGDDEPPRIELGLSDLSAEDVEAPAPTPAPTVRAPLTIDRVLAADLDGDGVDEILAGTGHEIRWGRWPADDAYPTWEGLWEGQGALQAWIADDLDGDGREEVLAALGVGRGFAQAALDLVLIDRDGGSTVVAPVWRRRGERNQVASLDRWPRADGGLDVYVAAFSTRFVVQGGVLNLDGGGPSWLDGHELRMGMVRAVADFDGDGQLEVAVGRLYGDVTDQPGDLRIIDDDGSIAMVPTLRGVRSVGAADVDGDGRAELLFGDGWHKDYGRHGRFRPSVASLGADGAWTVELVEERADQYAVEHIGYEDGRLIAGGNTAVWSYERTDGAWKAVSGPHRTSIHGAWAMLEGKLVVGGGRIGRPE
jgi:EF-P beta-lysylation protein EpmB